MRERKLEKVRESVGACAREREREEEKGKTTQEKRGCSVSGRARGCARERGGLVYVGERECLVCVGEREKVGKCVCVCAYREVFARR